MTSEDALDDALGAGRLPDVAGTQSTRPISAAASREHLLAPAGDHHLGAAAGELGGGRLAEVRPAAGDERHRSPRARRARTAPTGYSPSTLITRRFGRPPSNSQ